MLKETKEQKEAQKRLKKVAKELQFVDDALFGKERPKDFLRENDGLNKQKIEEILRNSSAELKELGFYFQENPILFPENSTYYIFMQNLIYKWYALNDQFEFLIKNL